MVRVLVAGLLVAGSAATVAFGLQVAQELIEPAAAPALASTGGLGGGAQGAATASSKGAGSFSPAVALTAAAEPRLIAAPVLVRGDEPQKTAAGARVSDVAVVYRDATPLLRPSATGANRGGDRYERARQLQRELARVGCYIGDADGDWGGASKRAMTAFLEKVNAVLPVDEPDPVLIALVQNHAAIACGGGCRPGEVVGQSGRCLPTGSVIARQEVPAPAPVGTWRTDVAAAPMEPVHGPAQAMAGSALPGRMALGALPTGGAPDTAVAPPAPMSVPLAVAKSASPPPAKKKKGEPAWARTVFPEVYGHR